MTSTKFTIENARHLVEMLMSSDNETVELAFRTLPGMDYNHYPHIYKFIMEITVDYWWANDRINNVVGALVIAKTLGWTHQEQQLGDLYDCEIEIAKALVEDCANRYMDSFLANTRFDATVTINYNETLAHV